MTFVVFFVIVIERDNQVNGSKIVDTISKNVNTVWIVNVCRSKRNGYNASLNTKKYQIIYVYFFKCKQHNSSIIVQLTDFAHTAITK